MSWNLLKYFKSEMTDGVLYQYSAGSRDAEGRWVPGGESSTAIELVAPQPVRADEIQQLEPGERITDYVKTWVYDTIPLSTRVGTSDADEVEVNSQRYKVHQINHWEAAGGFVAAILRREQ